MSLGKNIGKDVLAILGSGQPGVVSILHYPAFRETEALQKRINRMDSLLYHCDGGLAPVKAARFAVPASATDPGVQCGPNLLNKT